MKGLGVEPEGCQISPFNHHSPHFSLASATIHIQIKYANTTGVANGVAGMQSPGHTLDLPLLTVYRRYLCFFSFLWYLLCVKMWSISFPLERLKVTLNMLREEKVLLALFPLFHDCFRLKISLSRDWQVIWWTCSAGLSSFLSDALWCSCSVKPNHSLSKYDYYCRLKKQMNKCTISIWFLTWEKQITQDDTSLKDGYTLWPTSP